MVFFLVNVLILVGFDVEGMCCVIYLYFWLFSVVGSCCKVGFLIFVLVLKLVLMMISN